MASKIVPQPAATGQLTTNAAAALYDLRCNIAFDLLRIGKLADIANVLAGDLNSDRDEILTAASCISDLTKNVESKLDKAEANARAQGAQETESAQPPADAAIAAPAPDTQAGGASDDDGDERIQLALRAAWEIDGLAEMVYDRTDDDASGLPLRSLLRRIRRLCSVQMSAIDDDADALKDIQARFEETMEVSHG